MRTRYALSAEIWYGAGRAARVQGRVWDSRTRAAIPAGGEPYETAKAEAIRWSRREHLYGLAEIFARYGQAGIDSYTHRLAEYEKMYRR